MYKDFCNSLRVAGSCLLRTSFQAFCNQANFSDLGLVFTVRHSSPDLPINKPPFVICLGLYPFLYVLVCALIGK